MPSRPTLAIAVAATTLLVGVAAGGGPAIAQSCWEPSAPWCLMALSGEELRDPDQLEQCQDELSIFLEELESYRTCLIEETARVNERARLAILSFNCLITGGDSCPVPY